MLLAAIEEAAGGLACLPGVLASGGALPDGRTAATALSDGLSQLDGAIASLREAIGDLPVERSSLPAD